MGDSKKIISDFEHEVSKAHGEGWDFVDLSTEDAKEILELLKEHEPRKKGYWKYPQSLDCCCSECSNQPDHEPGESVPLYDYCPYCGAEMEVK